MFMVGTSTAVPFIQNGNVRALAVTADERLPSLPDIPTFAEEGLPGIDVSIWFAVLVPAATPASVVRKLNADIVRAVADPDYRRALEVRGFEAQSMSPEQLAAFLEKDYVKFRALIHQLKLQVD
jgi:tripartite-type tricarboxylate transporter receptor subunit TctC